jgi:septum formation protein
MTEILNQLALFPGVAEVGYSPTARVRRRPQKKQPFVPFDPSDRRYSRLILASSSPSKCDILTRLGLNFEVDPANIDEKSFRGVGPEILVKELAAAKGISVSKRHTDGLILSADTVIVSGGSVVGKPLDRCDALRILTDLNGRTHEVLTGLMVLDLSNERSSSKVVVTSVRFRQQSHEALARYVATGEPMGKAGAYALQGMGALLVEEVDGEYTNVLGLPVSAFVDALSELGYELI